MVRTEKEETCPALNERTATREEDANMVLECETAESRLNLDKNGLLVQPFRSEGGVNGHVALCKIP